MTQETSFSKRLSVERDTAIQTSRGRETQFFGQTILSSENKRSKMRFLLIFAIMLVGYSIVTKAEDEYIHLPGRNCDEAPLCPDNRPCVMGKPRCQTGTCPDLVPTCGPKP